MQVLKWQCEKLNQYDIQTPFAKALVVDGVFLFHTVPYFKGGTTMTKFPLTTADMAKSKDMPTFIKDSVDAWLGSAEYKSMEDNYKYYLGENPRLAALANKVAVDTGMSLNLKPQQNVYSDFFGRITKQHVGHLLKFPLQFRSCCAYPLGPQFDHVIFDILQDAYIQSNSWGLWNGENLVHLPARFFIPIYDADTEQLVCGIAFRRLRDDLPWQYYLYEPDGVTKYCDNGVIQQVTKKMPYSYISRQYNNETIIEPLYTPLELPIKPLYTNSERRSELTKPLRTQINAYDFLKTGYIDELLKSKFIYWLISGYGGQVDELIAIKETAQKLGIIARADNDGNIQPTIIEPPHTSHEKIMHELEKDIFRSAMAVNTDDLAGRASVSDAAILSSQAQEDLKIGIIWNKLKPFIMDIAALAGAQIEDVNYKPFKLSIGEMTDEQKVRGLQGWVDRGVPLKNALKHDPILQRAVFEP